jgi:hypothetical protein
LSLRKFNHLVYILPILGDNYNVKRGDKMRKVRVRNPDELKSFFSQLQQETENTESTVIGTVPPDLMEEYKAYSRAKDRLERELDNRITELAYIMKTTVENEFSDRKYDAEEQHNELWGKIYEQLGLDPDLSYTIDRRTNKISIEGPIPDNPFTH